MSNTPPSRINMSELTLVPTTHDIADAPLIQILKKPRCDSGLISAENDDPSNPLVSLCDSMPIHLNHRDQDGMSLPSADNNSSPPSNPISTRPELCPTSSGTTLQDEHLQLPTASVAPKSLSASSEQSQSSLPPQPRRKMTSRDHSHQRAQTLFALKSSMVALQRQFVTEISSQEQRLQLLQSEMIKLNNSMNVKRQLMFNQLNHIQGEIDELSKFTPQSPSCSSSSNSSASSLPPLRPVPLAKQQLVNPSSTLMNPSQQQLISAGTRSNLPSNPNNMNHMNTNQNQLNTTQNRPKTTNPTSLPQSAVIQAPSLQIHGIQAHPSDSKVSQPTSTTLPAQSKLLTQPTPTTTTPSPVKPQQHSAQPLLCPAQTMTMQSARPQNKFVPPVVQPKPPVARRKPRGAPIKHPSQLATQSSTPTVLVPKVGPVHQQPVVSGESPSNGSDSALDGPNRRHTTHSLDEPQQL